MSRKVLIVEDDPVFRNYLFTVLKTKFEVKIAANPIEAFGYLNAELFDLIVTDLRMPEMDGREFVEKVRSQISPSIPVIVITAFEDDWPVEEGILNQTYTFLRKGDFLPSELKAIVEEAIDKPTETESSAFSLNEIMFREILDNMPELLIVTDTSLKPLYVNRRFSVLTGIGIKDMNGSLSNILNSESQSNVTDLVSSINDLNQADAVLDIKGINESLISAEFIIKYMNTSDIALLIFSGSPLIGPHKDNVAIKDKLQPVIDELGLVKRENSLLRQRFKRLENSARGIILWLDSSYNCIYANPDIERLLGYKPSEFAETRISWKKFLHPDDHHIIDDTVLAVRKGISSISGQARIYSRAGLMVYLSWQASIFYNIDGELSGIELSAEDITQRLVSSNELAKTSKKLEEMRQEILDSPDERCRLVVEGSNTVIFTLDVSSHIVYINKKGLDELGVMKDEITGRPFKEFISDSMSYSRFETALWKIGEGSDPGVLNLSIDTKTGRSIWGINMWPIGTAQGKVEYAGVARDVTSEISNFKKLRLLANIEQYSADAIIGLDMERRIISWNRGAYMMFGWTEDEIIGSHSLNTIVPDNRRKEADELYEEVIEKGFVRDVEEIRRKKTGDLINVSISITALSDESGKTFGFSSIIKDITQQKRMEKALIQSERLAAMGKLSASISHEINNPLYGIKSCLKHVLNTEDKNQIDTQFVKLAIKETDRIAELIRNMKTFYQPSESDVVTNDINELLKEVLTFNKKYLEENKVRLELVLEDCPYIVAVPEQIKQVFLNLMNNSAEAMPSGGVLKVHTTTGGDGKHVIISFTDTGVGIAKEDIPKIFDMFYSKKPNVKGVGLGLSVSYGIIKRHGGKIEVESEPGEYTTFRITLPVKPGGERQLKLELL